MLKSAGGLNPNEVEKINVNWSLSPALLMGKQVDGVVGTFS